ncbi:aspartyl-phosphate phosphatase Spo0E family protein [Rossellomorea aquimaris]|uniref:aspartyl-phosphate phosphatase Spo0E family protein n=1 Tax=Rossellomorea aquimaris TaxID=189382 RepID=UPI0007D0821C|nr:aspartyl-phosphate phosphatase Spo0E family protein [Rossellomorea aquimaris]
MGRLLKKRWLLKKINHKRTEMISLGETIGLSAKETIECSQQLDQLLNEYDRCSHKVVNISLQDTPYEFGQFIKGLIKRTAS